MTATTETIERPPGAPTASVAAHPWIRFAAPLAAAVLATLTMGVAGIVAYDAWLDGRIVPGVRVGGVDLSGLGRDAATTRLGEHMLLSWYDRDRDFESPQHVSECHHASAVPGYVDYALHRGANLMVDVDNGRFVFFYLPVDLDVAASLVVACT